MSRITPASPGIRGRGVWVALAFAFELALAVPSFCQAVAHVRGSVVDAFTNEPLPHARVVLFRESSGVPRTGLELHTQLTPEQTEDPTAPLLVRTTDEDGKFEFGVIARARVRLFAAHPGYADWGVDGSPPVVFDLSEDRGPELIRMLPQSSISGSVADVDSGKSISGLRVVAYRWYSTGGSRALLSTDYEAFTDRNGCYVLRKVAAGTYALAVESARPARLLPMIDRDQFRDTQYLAYPRTFFPGSDVVEAAAAVTLSSGQAQSGLDIRIAKRRAAAVQVAILLPAELPSDSPVDVSFDRVETQGHLRTFEGILGGTVPGGQGVRLEGLDAGHYYLHAIAAKKSPTRYEALVSFDLDDRAVILPDLVLRPGVRVAGRVRLDESIQPQEVDLATLSILLKPQNRSFFENEEPAPVRDTKGHFLLEDVVEDTYDVLLRGLPKGLAVEHVVYNGAAAPPRNVKLTDEAVAHNIEIVVARAAASVDVVAMDGLDPGRDAQLVLIPAQDSAALAVETAVLLTADESGHGLFRNLLPGKYRLLAFRPAVAWRSEVILKSLLDQAITVDTAGSNSTRASVGIVDLR